MPKRRWSKRRVVTSGFVVIQRFFRFEGVDGAKGSMNASACAIRTIRISMAALGRVVRSAVSSGRHESTDSTPRTPLIGPDIEAWAGGHEAQIMSTKSAREEAFLDTLGWRQSAPGPCWAVVCEAFKRCAL